MIKLYSYWRSSAAYRVRIALELKQIPFQIVPVSLIDGEQRQAEYLALNPQGLLPYLIDDSVKDKKGRPLALGQSTAMLEYLEEHYSDNSLSLLPNSISARAATRHLANIIACDIHPLCNLRVLKYLQGEFNVEESEKNIWYVHWVLQGFKALETELERLGAENYCVDDKLSLADIYLIPQIYNANRFNISLQEFPCVSRIGQHCASLDAFIKAHPDNHPKDRNLAI